MSGLIPQDFIAELLNRIDIVDIIQLRVPLKRKGSEYSACCPFHNEKTPSFYVSPTKQFYHCFGCGAHGTAINFLMEYDNLSFPEAIEQLADSAGLVVPRNANAPRKQYDTSAIGILNRAASLYAQNLAQLPANHPVRVYLQNRGLSAEVMQTYQIGFATNSAQALQVGLDAQEPDLLAAGLLSESDNGRYLRFRDRIMFPIRNRRGDVIGFGGRALGDAKPKYLNSAETEFFHKGEELYGIFEARKATPRLEQLIVVEGYMDVVALAQFGITNAVATLGTATTNNHATLLARTVRNITFCFDGDRAGRQAAWKALENMLSAMRDGLHASFMFVPDGEDPDSLIRHEGTDAFRSRLTQATPLSDFLVAELQQLHNFDTIDGRANGLNAAVPLLAKLPSGTHFDSLLPEIARITRQHDDRILNLAQQKRQEIAQQAREQAAPQAPTRTPTQQTIDVAKTPLRRAIALLLCVPQLHQETRVQAARAKLPRPQNDEYFALLHYLLEILDNNPNSTTAMIIAQVENPRMQQALSKLATWRPMISDALLTDELVGALTEMSQRYSSRTEILEKVKHGLPLSAEEQAMLQKPTK